MESQRSKSIDNVTLVLRDHRIEANKKVLADSSRYFASLFSENFKDHRQEEFEINYEISPRTLHTFVKWASNAGGPYDSVDSVKYNITVKKPLQEYLNGNRSELLELLELSDVFMVEKLTDEILDMIMCMRFPPDEMLGVWSLVENLGCRSHADVILAVCLDRFDEMAISSLTDLSPEHFSRLLCNTNVRSSPERLMDVRKAWIERNGIAAQMSDFSSRFIKGEPDDVLAALKSAEPRYVQCVPCKKLRGAQSIFSWNGQVLQEFADIGRDITAKRVVARGVNIYVIGRKIGVDVGFLCTTIWRYCIFTKKWHVEAIMPRPRKDMGAVFLENRLYLFAGLDSNGQTITPVDVYDVHTGEWSMAADFPEFDSATRICSSFVAGGKILYRKWKLYERPRQDFVYDSLENKWKTLLERRRPSKCGTVDFITHLHFFIGWSERKLLRPSLRKVAEQYLEAPVLYVRDWTPEERQSYLQKFVFTPDLELVHMNIVHRWDSRTDHGIIDQQVMNGCQIVSFGYNKGRANVEVAEVDAPNGEPSPFKRLKTHSQELSDVPVDCFLLIKGCFNLIAPESLHATCH